MAAHQEQLVLYDLASKSNTPFSPSTLKTHYQLNYKGIPYTTQYIEFPEIAPLLTSFGIAAPPKDEGYGKHTVPAIRWPDGTCVMDSLAIYKRLETDPIYADLPKVVIKDDSRTESGCYHDSDVHRIGTRLQVQYFYALQPGRARVLPSESHGWEGSTAAERRRIEGGVGGCDLNGEGIGCSPKRAKRRTVLLGQPCELD